MEPARLDNLALDSVDPAAIAPFWCALLGVEVVDRLDDGRFLELGVPPAGGVAMILQRVPEMKVAKNRMHVDLEIGDLDEATAEIERLGGRWRDATTHDDHGFRWRNMADLQGNEFRSSPGGGSVRPGAAAQSQVRRSPAKANTSPYS